MGMASALETLCGQAYGAKQYHLFGIQLQRAIFALFCVSIPLAMIWANMGNILAALGQDPLISIEAGKYHSITLLQELNSAVGDSITLLQNMAQGDFHFASHLKNPIIIFWQYLVCIQLKYGRSWIQ